MNWTIEGINAIKAEAVKDFINETIGAFEAGLLEKNNLNLAELYIAAQNHCSNTYNKEIKGLEQQWGREMAESCGIKDAFKELDI